MASLSEAIALLEVELESNGSQLTDITSDVQNHVSGSSFEQVFAEKTRLFSCLKELLEIQTFGISINSLQLTEDVISKLGSAMQSHFFDIFPQLLDRLGDSRRLIQENAYKILRSSFAQMDPFGITTMVGKIHPALSDSSLDVQEKLCKLLTFIILEHDIQLPLEQILRSVIKALGINCDKKENSTQASFVLAELISLIRHKLMEPMDRDGIGSEEFIMLLESAGLDLMSVSGQMVTNRLGDPALPRLKSKEIIFPLSLSMSNDNSMQHASSCSPHNNGHINNSFDSITGGGDGDIMRSMSLVNPSQNLSVMDEFDMRESPSSAKLQGEPSPFSLSTSDDMFSFPPGLSKPAIGKSSVNGIGKNTTSMTSSTRRPSRLSNRRASRPMLDDLFTSDASLKHFHNQPSPSNALNMNNVNGNGNSDNHFPGASPHLDNSKRKHFFADLPSYLNDYPGDYDNESVSESSGHLGSSVANLDNNNFNSPDSGPLPRYSPKASDNNSKFRPSPLVIGAGVMQVKTSGLKPLTSSEKNERVISNVSVSSGSTSSSVITYGNGVVHNMNGDDSSVSSGQQQQQQQQPQQQPNKWESSNEDNEPQSASNPNTQQWLPSAGTNTSQYPRSVSQLNHHELMVARARGDVSIPHSGNGEDDDDDGPPMASRPRMARNSLDFDAMSKAKRLDNVMNEGMIGNTSTNNNNDDDHNNNNNNNSGSRRTIVEHTKGSGPTIGGARSSSISEDNDLNANLFSNNNSRIVSSDSVGVEKWGFSRSNKTSKKKNNNNNNDMTTDGDSEDYDTIEMPSKRVITASDRLSTLKKHSRQGVRRIFSADSGPAASPARRRVPHSTRSLSNRSFNFPSPAHSRFKNSSEDPKFAVPSNSRDVSTCPANDCVGGSMTDRPRRMSIEDEFKTASDHWTSISVSSTTSRNSRQRSGTKDMFDNENVGTCSPPPSLSAIGGNSGNHMNLPIQLSNNASPPQNRTLYDPTSPNSPNSINSSNVSSSTPLISPIKPPLLSKSRSRRRLIITQFDNNNNTHSIEPPATTTGVINDHLHNGIINSTKVETSNNSGGSQSVDAARNTLTRNPSFFGNNNENISVITRSLPDHINQQDQHQPSSAMTVMGRQSPFNDPTPNRRSSSYNNGEVVAGPNLMNEFEGAIISPSNANAFPAREPASGKRRLSLLRGSHTPSTRPPLPRNRQFADSPPTGTRNRHGSMDMQFSSDAAREEFNDMEISGSGRYSAIPFQSSSPSPPHNNNHNNNNISLSPSNPQPHHLHGTSNIDFNSNDPSSNPSFDPFQASAGSMHYQQRHPSNINNTATNNNNNNYNNTTNNYTISSTNSTPSTSQSPELTSHSPSTSNSPHNLGSRSRRQRGTFSNMSNNNNSSNTNGTSDNIEDYSINDKFSVRSPPRTNASTPKGTSTKRNRAGVRGRSQTDSAIDVPISISQSSDKNYQSSEELQPYNNPEKALNETVSLLRTTDWKKQCQGLNNSRRLALHHSSVFARQVKDVCSLIVSHCLSLRSVVSKTGILAAQDVIKGMGKRLDSYLDIFCKPLLKKASDASGFLGEEALKALKFMNTSCSWQRVLATMNDICKDTSSTAGPLRANASAVMLHCVSVVGASLSEYRLLDGIVRTCGQLLTDSKEETRRNAKGMCVELVASGAVPLSKLKVLIPPKFYDTVEKLVAKGSGSGGVFGFASGGNSGGGVVPGASIGLDGDRSTPTYRGTPKSAVGTPSSRTRTRSKTDYFAGSASSSNEELQKILLEVNGKDWKDRITAIQNLQSLINTNSASVNTSSILKISESLVTRITDPNVRVSTTALKCAESLISKTSLNAPSVTVLMAALFSSSVSSNTAVSKGSNKSLNSLFLNVNVKDVVVPMVNLILNVRNQKIKPVVLDRIVDVIPTLAMEHSGLMYKHLVPAILKCVLQPKLKREEKRSLAACCLALKQTGPKFISAARARLPDSGFQLLEKMTS